MGYISVTQPILSICRLSTLRSNSNAFINYFCYNSGMDYDFEDAVIEAWNNGIKADTSLEVREALVEELRENGHLPNNEAVKFCGLGIDYSGPGRPQYIIVDPTPESDFERLLNPH